MLGFGCTRTFLCVCSQSGVETPLFSGANASGNGDLYLISSDITHIRCVRMWGCRHNLQAKRELPLIMTAVSWIRLVVDVWGGTLNGVVELT